MVYFSQQINLPTVSLCTVTRNRQFFIDLLASHILNQDYPLRKIQWIIIDDGDYETKIPDNIISEIEVSYQMLKTRMPLGEKRNLANKVATGEIILNMDDDDYYPPSRIMHAVDSLLQKPYYLMAGCSSIPCLNIHNDKLWILNLPYASSAIASTFAFRRELLELTSYDSQDNYGEEYSFLRRLERPMIQLNPFKTVINIAHRLNTVNKSLVERFNQSFIEYIQFNSVSFQEVKTNYLLAEENCLKQNKLMLDSGADGSTPLGTKSALNSWRDLGILSCECISLRSSISRRRQMISHTEGLDIEIYFFDAIDKNDIESFSTGKSSLKKSQIGCTLSHLFLLNSLATKFDRLHDSMYLVVEDDVELKPQFDADNLLKSLPFNWDIIQLGTNNPCILDILFAQHEGGDFLVPTLPSSWGTFAYLINPRGARRLASRFLSNSWSSNIDFVGQGAEFLADKLLFDNLNSYTLCSPLARPRTDQISSIGYSDEIVEKTINASNKIAKHWYS